MRNNPTATMKPLNALPPMPCPQCPQEYYMRNNPTATMALPTELFIILVSCLVGWVSAWLW